MMFVVNKVALYFHTIRYLKPVQIYWRLWIAIRPSRIPPLRTDVALRPGFSLKESLPDYSFKDDNLTFLNVSVNISSGMPWHDHSLSRLWLYNLHYFHYLACPEVKGGDVIRDWIDRNPAVKGVAWEPYPTALRIVSWVKYHARMRNEGRANDIPDSFIPSLYQQARHMERNLEFHLQGNHLLKDIKALLFAGCFFDGPEAERWLQKGHALLESQLKEQILQDGGHFERSPMYHAIVLEDLLDIYNVFSGLSATQDRWVDILANLVPYIMRMIRWQEILTHPDGDIALFNDSSLMGPARLRNTMHYASRLGISAQLTSSGEELIHLEHSGYCVARMGQFTSFVDVGEIGPSYLPGHAHCDTLSYELSVGAQRVIVDTGVFGYEADDFRQHVRSTAAHNTVVIDGEEQSEIWKSFRVGRRAHPLETGITKLDDGGYVVHAAHGGYQRLNGRPVHRRKFSIDRQGMTIEDRLDGEGRHGFASYIHFFPGLNVKETKEGDSWLVLNDRGAVLLEIEFHSGYPVTISDSWYCPEFGKRMPGKVLICAGEGIFPVSMSYTIKVV